MNDNHAVDKLAISPRDVLQNQGSDIHSEQTAHHDNEEVRLFKLFSCRFPFNHREYWILIDKITPHW